MPFVSSRKTLAVEPEQTMFAGGNCSSKHALPATYMTAVYDDVTLALIVHVTRDSHFLIFETTLFHN